MQLFIYLLFPRLFLDAVVITDLISAGEKLSVSTKTSDTLVPGIYAGSSDGFYPHQTRNLYSVTC